MAVMTRGTTVTSTTTVTAQTLHDLIELAQVGTVVPSDIEGGTTQLIRSQAGEPNASIYPFWYSTDPVDPIFRVYARPWNIWLAVGPHRIEVPLLNGSATSLRMGTLVVAHTSPSTFTIGTNPSLNAIGFLQASTASGAYGPVAIKGIGWGLWCSAVSAHFADPRAGHMVGARNVLAGTVMTMTQVNTGSAMSGPLFGVSLERSRSGFSGTFERFRMLIWGGGRVSHQGGSF